MLSLAHAVAIEADRLLDCITQSRQKGDTRLADRSNIGVGTRRWAFKQDMPQVVTRPIVAVTHRWHVFPRMRMSPGFSGRFRLPAWGLLQDFDCQHGDFCKISRMGSDALSCFPAAP
jgi:hypothetical protein